MMHGLVTIAKYKLEEILPFIGTGMPRKQLVTAQGTFNVKMNSPRLECFKRNQTCVACGMKGEMFRLQRHHKHGTPRSHMKCFIKECPWCSLRPIIHVGDNSPHLNMYGRNAHGSIILFTQDHIIPRCAKGSNKQDNLQVMCTKCNGLKGGMMPEEYEQFKFQVA